MCKTGRTPKGWLARIFLLSDITNQSWEPGAQSDQQGCVTFQEELSSNPPKRWNRLEQSFTIMLSIGFYFYLLFLVVVDIHLLMYVLKIF